MAASRFDHLLRVPTVFASLYGRPVEGQNDTRDGRSLLGRHMNRCHSGPWSQDIEKKGYDGGGCGFGYRLIRAVVRAYGKQMARI